MPRNGLTIGKTRTVLYRAGKILGDINAVARGTIQQRLLRRGLGFVFGRAIGSIVRVIFKKP